MRIAIVNDVVMAIEAMRRVVISSGQHHIAWTARDGSQAIERCLADTPDLILMDLIMPGIDGVQATRQIMARCPCAVLVVTANVTDNCAKAFEAMGAGALDAVNTPVLEWPGACKGAQDLLAKIETIRKFIGAKLSRPLRTLGGCPETCVADGRLIAIGASAGGPVALARILNYLPGTFSPAVVVVQHVDAQFAPALANWLDAQTPLRVRLAQEADKPSPGTILLAGRDQHLVFTEPGRLGYVDEPADSSYHPSVDVFFNSISPHWAGNVTAIVLTGMGRDGSQGLLNLRQAGYHTIAQDQQTSSVYGMPKAAAQLNAADEILSLDQIGLRLRALASNPIKVHA